LPVTAFDAIIALLADCPARYRSDALLALARHAPTDRLMDFLHFACDVGWAATPPEAKQQPWIHLMAEIGPRLYGPDAEAAALAVARALNVSDRAEAIEELAPYLGVELARSTLRDIDAGDPYEWENQSQMIAAGALTKRLPVDEARSVLERYVKKYCHVDDNLRLVPQPQDTFDEPSSREAQCLAPAAAHLPDDAVRRTIRSVCRSISLGATFARELTPSLARLAPKIAREPSLLREAIDMVLTVSPAWRPASRLTVLSVLAPHLRHDALRRAMTELLPGPVDTESFAAIAALGLELPSNQRDTVANRALGAAFKIASDTQRTRAIGAVAPMLNSDLAKQALNHIRALARRVLFPSFLTALDNLAAQIDVDALPTAFDIFLDAPQHQMEHAPRLFERLGRADPTRAVAIYFQPNLMNDASPHISSIWRLAPLLSPALAGEALQVARTLPNDYARRLSIAALAPHVPAELRHAAVDEVLALLEAPPDQTLIRIAVLGRLLAALPSPSVVAACRQTLSEMTPNDLYGSSPWSKNAVDEFFANLPSELVPEALHFSTDLLPQYQWRIIRQVAPKVLDDDLPALIDRLQADPPGTGAELREHARALIAVAAEVSDEKQSHDIFSTILDRVVKRRWWEILEPAFTDLIPLLPPPLRSHAVAAAIHQCFDQYRLGDTTPLLAVLGGAELDLAFEELERIRDPHHRANAAASVLRRAGALADASATPLRDVDVIGTWPSTSTRAEVFAIVGASAWWLRRQGGDPAVAEAVDAVFDVSRWWR
jgi:hypothetical protein